MHIEPGVVNGVKMVLSYATGAGSLFFALRLAVDALKRAEVLSLVLRVLLSAALTFIFFEVLPKFSVGVSEVHFIFGATLFLLFGVGPAAIGLGAGLILQGLFFAPSDLPQYFMNVTTLLVPLFGVSVLAKRVIPAKTAYVDLRYRDVLRLSAAYQSGIVAWVAFWAFYGQGFGADTFASVSIFGVAYLSVIVVEPILDLGVLALAKAYRGVSSSVAFTPRLTSS